MITTVNQVYDIVNRIIRESRAVGREDIAKKLEDAMRLGGLGLEIIGDELRAIRSEVKKFAAKSEIEGIIRFVNHVYTGRP